jgi:hypothetical protein
MDNEFGNVVMEERAVSKGSQPVGLVAKEIANFFSSPRLHDIEWR